MGYDTMKLDTAVEVAHAIFHAKTGNAPASEIARLEGILRQKLPAATAEAKKHVTRLTGVAVAAEVDATGGRPTREVVGEGDNA